MEKAEEGKVPTQLGNTNLAFLTSVESFVSIPQKLSIHKYIEKPIEFWKDEITSLLETLTQLSKVQEPVTNRLEALRVLMINIALATDRLYVLIAAKRLAEIVGVKRFVTATLSFKRGIFVYGTHF